MAQELYAIGYYIYTVDGPRVTVDYYSVDAGIGESPFTTTPPLTGRFSRWESFGYSLNGAEFVIAKGEDYCKVRHTVAAGNGFIGTTVKVLAGMNASAGKTLDGRDLAQLVDVGWTARDEIGVAGHSDMLSVWGMASNMGSDRSDVHVLSLSFDPARLTREQLASGLVALATQDANRNWVNAVDANIGGTNRFVPGAWHEGYELGNYGIDPATNTAWAVVNHGGNFVVASVPEHAQAKAGDKH